MQNPSDKREPAPGHYSTGMQPWDVVQEWGLDFFTGNVVKYICRSADGNPRKKHPTPEGILEDLKKAKTYLDERVRMQSRLVKGIEDVRKNV